MSRAVRLRMTEWDEVRPNRGTELEGVFISDIPKAGRVVEALARGPMLEVDELRGGTRIRSFAFVGRVSLGDIEVTIEPKLPQLPLMTLLRYACGSTQLSRLSSTSFATEADSFQDLLIEQLVQEGQSLLAGGLVRRYSRQHSWLSSPRGRIDISAFARAPQTIAKLPCVHFPRLIDWAPNRLIYAGLQLGASLATRLELRSSARQLACMLKDEVTLVPLNRTLMSDWLQVRSRQTRGYDPAIELIRLLASGAGISFSTDEESIRLPGFLFDMNRFFQTVLSRFLQEHLHGYEVEVEHRLKRVMSHVRGSNPRNRMSPTPRPDFAILRNGQTVRFLDAKYRDLWNRSLPAHMLYQLAIYAMAGGADRTSSILYPATDPQAKDALIAVRDPVHGTALGLVALRPVNLIALADLIREGNRRVCGEEALRWTGLRS